MSDALELIARAAAFGMVLSSAGLHLRVESVTGVTVPAAFRAELVAAKPELLAYLSWQEAADRLLLESTRTLASEYPSGCPLDSPEWVGHDDDLHAAYWSGDLELLRRTLAERMGCARDAFTAFRREVERPT